MILAALFAAATQSSCANDFAAYEAIFLGDRRFQIDAIFETPQAEFYLNHNPTDERPEGQSASVRDITAFDNTGSKTEISYTGEGSWLAPQGASRISYQIVADHDQVEWPYGADEVGHPFSGGFYFTGGAFFVGPYAEKPSCSVRVHFDAPKDWTLTAPWATDGLNGIALSDYDLLDNGFAIGPFKTVVQNTGDLTLTSVFDPKLAKEVRPFVSKVLGDLIPAYSDYFGGQPAANYSTFHFAYSSSDGSAFERSFTLQYEWPLNLAEKPVWAHVLAHETMHLWTGAVQRADHEIEWYQEGFTDYLAAKHLYREGYLDDEGMRHQLAIFVSRHQLGKRLSNGVGLRDAGLNKGNNWFLIYGSGALFALMLDAEMSTAEPGSFDAMMADLYVQSEEPYDFERLMSFMDVHSNGRAREIFNAVDNGLRHNGVNALLAPNGIEVAGRMEQTYISFNKDCRKVRGCAPNFLKRK